VIGQLRHRVTFQSPAATLDEVGGQAIVWQDAATVWARIVALGGPEILRAAEIVPRGAYRLTIRYRTDIGPAMRIAFGDKTLQIDAVFDPEGDGKALFVDCNEASTP
jgi:SPP1 family predicted phage head-tail adaptor